MNGEGGSNTIPNSKLKKVVGPDPRLISEQVPINFKNVDGKTVYMPNWWVDIPEPPKFVEAKKKKKG